MKVYRIKTDVNNSRWIIPDVPDSDSLDYVFDCTPRTEDWTQPRVYFLDKLEPETDFLKFGTGALVCNSRAAEIAGAFFESAGELLPIMCEGKEYFLLNVLECISVLDAGKIRQTADKWITKFSFYEDQFTDSSIFKIPETCAIDVLAWERDGSPEYEFKACVEANGLTGLVFEELWDSENESIS